jgi:hypothetical protein
MGQGENIYSLGARSQQDFGAFIDGGSRGKDIIDEKDDLLLNTIFVGNPESPLDLFLSL